ncbi:HlyC/CorC family transporter [Stenotrophobium rhamnosiphilum]|uniref:HlyC/CorC family transporter n=2 Tax=Stenotrophobium rhamnosiphilum TaxID=2029166 RepID=A0A2T5MEM4_9GAMM|nr:HlyC/CorC family transporter [Stenotrophobium rhamnosiphilum]
MGMTENIVLVLFALLLVLLNGFFVAAEFAIVKLRHTRVEELKRVNGIRGRILAKVHQRMDAYLSACQLGITLASLGLGWIGEPAFARLIEVPLAMMGLDNDPATVHTIAFIFAFGVISYLHIVVGELAPKSAALRKPEAMSLWTAIPLYLFYWLMYPFIYFLNASANAMLRRIGLEDKSKHGYEVPYTHEELRTILHLSRAGTDERDSDLNRMLAHTLDLPNLWAGDVMRSRFDLIGIADDLSHAEVLRTLQVHRYSRYPFIAADSEEILGILHLKDIFLEGPGPDYSSRLRSHLRPAERFTEETPVAQLLRGFRMGSTHLALVESTDGVLAGFVTMEDVLEAVFGPIADEHDKVRPEQSSRVPRWLDGNSLLVHGETPLYMLEREIGVTLSESETLNTVNGLLRERLEQIPRVGDSTEIGTFSASVLQMDGASIEAMVLTRRSEAGDS